MNGMTLALALGATISWSSTWVLMRAGIKEMDRTAFGLLRPWFGLLFIIPFAWATQGFQFGSPLLILIALASGFLNAYVGVAFFYYALTHGSMHESNILAGTNPFWAALSAIVVLGEPARWEALIAALLIVAGTYFLAQRGPNDKRAHGIAPTLAALGAGILWGFTVAVPSKYCLTQGMSPIGYQLVFTVSGALAWTVAAMPKLMRKQLTFSRKGVWIAFASAFSGLFLGWVLWLVAMRSAPACALAPLNGLTLLFAVLLGAAIFRERLTARIILGGALCSRASP